MTWKIREKLKQLASQEQGALAKDWGGKCSAALLYPNVYSVGMGNLAVHSIYRILNASPAIACERAFMPGKFDMAEHRTTGTPVLSIESQRPLSDFDAIALTCSFENDYLNIIPALTISRIPHRAAERTDDHPLIIAGGAAPTLNPMPLSLIADAVFLGEFEAFADRVIPIMEARLTKMDAIAELEQIPGVMIGPSKKPIARRHIESLDPFKTETIIYSMAAEFGDMHLIEIERGCPRNCRFCATPVIYGKPRLRSQRAIMAMVEDGLAHRRKFGLVGADILSHPKFESIAASIIERKASFSPSSVRVDAIDEGKARLLHDAGLRSIALGIEAGSEGLRRTLGKGISDERILVAAETLAQAGITRLRLYFMIGLPGETEADIAAIAPLAVKIRDAVRGKAPRSQRSTAIDLTVTPFVPKPCTPFEETTFAGEGALKRKIGELKKALAREKGISMRTDSIVDAMIEHRIANSDERCLEFLEEAHKGNARAALKRD